MGQARVPVKGVAMTAIGVAAVRARESERDDRLYDDPLAPVFVGAARAGFAATDEGAGRWSRLQELTGAFYEGRTVSIRLVDDGVAEAVHHGCRQIVVLGAGLDTRAFRMPLPAGIRLFEIDLPELFAFKEPVLASVNARPVCERRVVAVDLRQDWASALLDNGFQPDVATHWVEEGTLAYLPRDNAQQVAATLTELSAPDSRLGVLRLQAKADTPPNIGLRRLARGEPQADAPLGRPRRPEPARPPRLAHPIRHLGRPRSPSCKTGRHERPRSRHHPRRASLALDRQTDLRTVG